MLEMQSYVIQKSNSVFGSIDRMSALPLIGDGLKDQLVVSNWNGDWDKWDKWDKWDQNR